MKVASLLTLKSIDENILNLWIDTLPVNTSLTLRRRLWGESKKCKTLVWLKYEGFIFY